MPTVTKKRKDLSIDVESDNDDYEDKAELSSPSCTVAANAASNSTKIKCLKCFRAARKGVWVEPDYIVLSMLNLFVGCTVVLAMIPNPTQ